MTPEKSSNESCLGQWWGETYPIKARHPFLRPRAPGHKHNPSPYSNIGRRVRVDRRQVGPSPFVDHCNDFVRERFPTSVRVGTWRPSLDGQAGVEHEDAIFGPSNKVPEIETASVTAA
jgi:hypothetical protein